jgi:hypothetical protein
LLKKWVKNRHPGQANAGNRRLMVLWFALIAGNESRSLSETKE